METKYLIGVIDKSRDETVVADGIPNKFLSKIVKIGNNTIVKLKALHISYYLMCRALSFQSIKIKA